MAAALAVALHVLAPEPPVGEQVVVAATDVAAGTMLTPGLLRPARWRPVDVPDGVLTDPSAAVGRTLGSGLRAGEPLTDARLVGTGLLVGRPEGEVAVAVRIADPQAASLARPGDRVDVLVATGTVAGAEGAGAESPRRTARSVARRATVLARPDQPASDDGLLAGADDPSTDGLLVLAVDAEAARDLAEAAAQGPLSLVLH